MKDFTLAELSAAAERGAVIAEEVKPYLLVKGDVIFWEGAWRTVDSTGTYKMKDNRKVYMTAHDFEGKEYIRRFDLPRYENVLRKVVTGAR